MAKNLAYKGIIEIFFVLRRLFGEKIQTNEKKYNKDIEIFTACVDNGPGKFGRYFGAMCHVQGIGRDKCK